MSWICCTSSRSLAEVTANPPTSESPRSRKNSSLAQAVGVNRRHGRKATLRAVRQKPITPRPVRGWVEGRRHGGLSELVVASSDRWDTGCLRGTDCTPSPGNRGSWIGSRSSRRSCSPHRCPSNLGRIPAGNQNNGCGTRRKARRRNGSMSRRNAPGRFRRNRCRQYPTSGSAPRRLGPGCTWPAGVRPSGRSPPAALRSGQSGSPDDHRLRTGGRPAHADA